jgi:predicted exporter
MTPQRSGRSAIGLTAGSGILLALVLSPAVVVLVRRDQARW